MARLIVIMGVSGCGKSTIGQMLADRLGVTYLEGDELHPAENVAKMSAGTPLTDADRAPWFDAILRTAQRESESGSDGATDVVLGCSALKASYRQYLLKGFPESRFIYLKGDFEIIRARMEQRQHFMPPELLRSQFDTLEEPTELSSDQCLKLDIQLATQSIVDHCQQWLS